MNRLNTRSQYLSSEWATPGANRAMTNSNWSIQPSTCVRREEDGWRSVIGPLLRAEQTGRAPDHECDDGDHHQHPGLRCVSEELLQEAVRGAEQGAAAGAAEQLAQSA